MIKSSMFHHFSQTSLNRVLCLNHPISITISRLYRLIILISTSYQRKPVDGVGSPVLCFQDHVLPSLVSSCYRLASTHNFPHQRSLPFFKIFALVNPVINTMMYDYLAYKTLRIRFPRIVSIKLTLSQIVQNAHQVDSVEIASPNKKMRLCNE